MKASEIKARRENAERALKMFNAKVIRRSNFGRQLTVAFPDNGVLATDGNPAVHGPAYLRGMQGLNVTRIGRDNSWTLFEVDLTRKQGAPPLPKAAEPGVAETLMVAAITRTRAP